MEYAYVPPRQDALHWEKPDIFHAYKEVEGAEATTADLVAVGAAALSSSLVAARRSSAGLRVAARSL